VDVRENYKLNQVQDCYERITMTFQKVRDKITNLQVDLDLFKADFLDRDGFKQFADNLSGNINGYNEVCITGYFSETIRKELETVIKRGCHVRLICPEFPVQSSRDRKNLQALRKLVDAGAEIKVNDRLHARFLVAYFPELTKHIDGNELRNGLLVVGSFDFNTECIGQDRYDAGIKTKHPDLIESAVQLFEQIWREPESVDLQKKYPKE
jgi:hypothetical protein